MKRHALLLSLLLSIAVVSFIIAGSHALRDARALHQKGALRVPSHSRPLPNLTP